MCGPVCVCVCVPCVCVCTNLHVECTTAAHWLRFKLAATSPSAAANSLTQASPRLVLLGPSGWQGHVFRAAHLPLRRTLLLVGLPEPRPLHSWGPACNDAAATSCYQ